MFQVSFRYLEASMGQLKCTTLAIAGNCHNCEMIHLSEGKGRDQEALSIT